MAIADPWEYTGRRGSRIDRASRGADWKFKTGSVLELALIEGGSVGAVVPLRHSVAGTSPTSIGLYSVNIPHRLASE